MKIDYYKEYSSYLDRDMEFKMYGHDGILCLVIPCQDGRFYEWEDRRMFNQVQDLIDEGRIRFVTVDSVDKETWSSFGDSASRMVQQENWVNYVMNELIPSALAKAGQPADAQMMVMGASMGATHAANLFFRFPYRFTKLLALSGIYDMSPYIYDGNFDGNFYQNNPMSYLPNMALDHNYIPQYNKNKAVFVVGQGAWENERQADLRKLENTLKNKGIQAEINFWGYDIPYDWPSWERQLRLYLPQIV